MTATEADRRQERMCTPETAGDRSESERDRDRVLYTEAFRRLSGVSQVAFTGETELYHDRLSHSLKVAQVGRRIAEYLEEEANEKGIPLDENVVETAALAHDIGHPPFGHPAERELDNILKRKGIEEGFEGNAQSLRVLTRVTVHPETEGPDVKSPGGINLTRASINASIKYPWKRSAERDDYNRWGINENEKFGRYQGEKDVFNWAREFSDGKQRCLEAEIMNWADDLVYAVHDVEDFYRSGVIPLEQLLRRGSPERKEFVNDYLNWSRKSSNDKFEYDDKVDDWLDQVNDRTEIQQAFKGTRGDRVVLNKLMSWLIGRFVGDDEETDFAIEVNSSPQGSERYLEVDSELKKQVSVLKFMLLRYVLDNPSLQAQRRGERKVIEELFEILFDAVDPHGPESVDIIHQPFRDEAKQLTADGTLVQRGRLVSDIITSMTEAQSIRLHKRLTGDSPGSIREYIVN